MAEFIAGCVNTTTQAGFGCFAITATGDATLTVDNARTATMPLTCNCPAKPSCVDSRMVSQYRRRRYLCPSCGKRWSSVEVVVGELEGRGKAIASLQDMFANEAYLRLRRKLVEILVEENVDKPL